MLSLIRYNFEALSIALFLHTVLKYIGYFAEIPVPLPKDIQSDIFESMELSVSPSKYMYMYMYLLFGKSSLIH